MNRFAITPAPPYFVVTFTSHLPITDNPSYGAMAAEMAELAAQQPGFLGVDSARDADGFGITNSYWADRASIKAWKKVIEHVEAQKKGHEWYSGYRVRIAQVERAYGFDKN